MFNFFSLCLAILYLVSMSTGLPQILFGPTVPSKCIVKEASSGQQKPCFLPFTFNNRIFSTCTNFTDPDGKPWCSTKIDDQGYHIGKIEAWGHCDMSNEACSGQTTKRQEDSTPPTLTTSSTNFKDDSKGTWKPSEEKGECGIKYTNENIIGGEIAKPGEFPYMALLGYKYEDDQIIYACGGTLINRYYVLTAAHCQTGVKPIHNVLIGEHIVGINPDCNESGTSCFPSVQDIEVENVTVHEDYDKVRFTAGNDIALVRLSKPVILSYDAPPGASSASPICLPWLPTDPGQDFSKVTGGTITGWGRITNDKEENKKNLREFQVASRTLRRANVPIAKDSECLVVSRDFSSTKQICAGGQKDVDSCNGDSGGPLAFRGGLQDDSPWYLIGVVSFGTKECGVGKPGVYTKVTSYLNWIEKNMKP